MANDKKDAIKDLFYSIGLFVFIVLEIVLAYWALFNQGGAEQETNIFIVLISLGIGIFGAVLMFLLKFGQFLSKLTKSEKSFGWMGCIIHDPETSDIPFDKKGLRWFKNPLIVFILSWIIFSIVGVFQVYQNTFFTAIPERVSQQITETAQGILSTIPADQEIWVPVALSGLLVTLFTWLGNTKRIDKAISKVLIYLVVPIIFTLAWVGVHRFHHGNSDIAIQYVMLFGLICSYLLVLLRTVIPVLVFKITGNLYQYLNGIIQADENILMITLVINIVIVVITALILTLTASSKQKLVVTGG